MSQFFISSLCFLHSVTIFLYDLVRRKLKPESVIPQLSWLCMSTIPSTITVCAHLVWVLAHYTALLSVSCWLMGDTLMPPSSGFHSIDFRSFILEYESRVSWVPWDLQSSVVGSLAIDSFGNTSMSPDRWIIPSVQPQHINQWLQRCIYIHTQYFVFSWITFFFLIPFIPSVANTFLDPFIKIIIGLY